MFILNGKRISKHADNCLENVRATYPQNIFVRAYKCTGLIPVLQTQGYKPSLQRVMIETIPAHI